MGTAAPPQRLRASADVVATLRSRRERVGRHLVLHARETDADHPVRVAVVASRRVGGAVARNRAKRLLREAARHVSWRDGFDLVLVARASCAGSSFQVVRDELRHLGEELGVIGSDA